jgi:glycerol-3-phosphate dehydrogenase
MSGVGPRTFDRAEGLRRLAGGRFDVIVVGGGLDGAAVALDAAARGLRTAVVDSDDWAGDSSDTLVPAPAGPHRAGWPWATRDDLAGLTRTAPHLVHGPAGAGGSIDAARLSLALVRTATLDYGAVAANRVRLVGVRAGDRAGRRW